MKRQHKKQATDPAYLKMLQRILKQISTISDLSAAEQQGEGVVLILGNTGSGKSTFVNYLAGCPMREVDKGGLEPVIEADHAIMEIGHGFDSKTIFPQRYVHEAAGLCYCDCPGFFDNRGPEFDIPVALSIKQMLHTQPIKGLIVMVNYHSLTADKARNLQGTADLLTQLFGTTDRDILDYQACIRLLVSKAHTEEEVTSAGLRTLLRETDNPLMMALGERALFYDPLGREGALARGAQSRQQILETIRCFPGISNTENAVGYALSIESKRTISELASWLETSIRENLASWNITAVEDLLAPFRKLCILDDRFVGKACHRVESIIRDQIIGLGADDSGLEILNEICQQLPDFRKEAKTALQHIQERREQEQRHCEKLAREKAVRKKAEKAAVHARTEAQRLEEKNVGNLVKVCEEGDLEKVKIYVTACKHPDLLSIDGKHPLTAAIWGLNIDVVRYLFKHIYHQEVEVLRSCLNHKGENSLYPPIPPELSSTRPSRSEMERWYKTLSIDPVCIRIYNELQGPSAFKKHAGLARTVVHNYGSYRPADAVRLTNQVIQNINACAKTVISELEKRKQAISVFVHSQLSMPQAQASDNQSRFNQMRRARYSNAEDVLQNNPKNKGAQVTTTTTTTNRLSRVQKTGLGSGIFSRQSRSSRASTTTSTPASTATSIVTALTQPTTLTPTQKQQDLFIQACLEGNLGEVQNRHQGGASLTTPNLDGLPALKASIHSLDISTAQYIAEHLNKVDQPDEWETIQQCIHCEGENSLYPPIPPELSSTKPSRPEMKRWYDVLSANPVCIRIYNELQGPSAFKKHAGLARTVVHNYGSYRPADAARLTNEVIQHINASANRMILELAKRKGSMNDFVCSQLELGSSEALRGKPGSLPLT